MFADADRRFALTLRDKFATRNDLAHEMHPSRAILIERRPWRGRVHQGRFGAVVPGRARRYINSEPIPGVPVNGRNFPNFPVRR
jgi:hypothetical protein